MLEDIASATSSVHINQFGFRPGVVGDGSPRCSLAKARRGRPGRGSSSTGRAPTRRAARSEFYERLAAGGRRGLRRPRDEAARAAQARSAPARRPLEPPRARAHRPPQGRRRRRSHRLGRRRRDRGPLRGRALPRPVPAGRRARSSRSCSSSSSASFRWLGGRCRSTTSTPSSRRTTPAATRDPGGRPPQRPRPLPADHRRDRRAARRTRARPSTSSTRTSPTAA